MSAQVPSLNLEKFASQRDEFVRELGAAYESFGFCGIHNHGIDERLKQDAYAVFREFFALPARVKRQYECGAGGLRGYIGFGIETARDADHPDLKEFWQVGRELPEGHRLQSLMPPNRWPREVANFRRHAYALYQALDRVGRQVLQAMALYLGESADFFADKVNEGNSILRPIHYPPIETADTPSLRASSHEDINLITLLIGSEQPGLEILSRQGEWIAVTGVPGAIICNVGDMLQRLSNHVFPSTTHRVTNAACAYAGKSRFSVPYFLHPNPDYQIRTLPGCISADRPDRYSEPITAHDFLQQRLLEIGLLQQAAEA